MTAPTGSGRPHLDPDVVAVVQSSAHRLAGREALLVAQAEAALRDVLPAEPVLRSAEAGRVARHFAVSILDAAATLRTPQISVETLRAAGAELQRAGLPVAAYGPAGHALLRALRAVYPRDWSAALSSAWVGYYLWACECLRYGADTVQADGATGADGAGDAGPPDASGSPDGTPEHVDPNHDLDDLEDLDDLDDDEPPAYGAIMVAMTSGGRRHTHRT